jgi:hypothetical protein
MITKINGKNFKGQDFEQKLGPLNLLIGANGSGKSSRSMALELLVNGYIMGVGKRNSDVMDACGAPGEGKIFVGCSLLPPDGKVATKFLKRYARAEDGGVSLAYQVRDTKATVANYIAAWTAASGPRLVDPDTFTSLSKARQVEELLALFPPEDDITELDKMHTLAKETLQAKNKEKLGLEGIVFGLSKSLSEIETGTGTLAEVNEEVKSVMIEIDKAKAELARLQAEEQARKQMEAETADLARRAEEEKRIAEQKYRDLAEKSKLAKEKAEAEATAKQAALERDIVAAENRLKTMAAKKGIKIPAATPGADAGIEAINRIMDAIDQAECGACAAMLVAKQQKRLLQQGGAK